MTTPTMTPAGWYPDPSLRHELRYWDGNEWSPQVSDGGVTSTDPELRPEASPDGARPVPVAPPVMAPAVPVAPAGAGYPTPSVPGSGAPAAAGAGRRRWVIPVIAIVAVLAVIAGLGIWRVATRGPSVAQLYEQMRESAATAKSVHIKGALIEKGQKLQIDLAGDRVGKNSRAAVVQGSDEVEILTVNGNYYFKANAAYYAKNASAAVAKLAGGKYVKVPAGAAASLGNLKAGALLDQILAKDKSNADKLSSKVEKTQVDGVPAYLMTGKIGSDGSKVYASTDSPAHLLRIENAKTHASLDFTEWNAVAPVSEPPAGQVVELPGL